jgi:hypothetical protein
MVAPASAQVVMIVSFESVSGKPKPFIHSPPSFGKVGEDLLRCAQSGDEEQSQPENEDADAQLESVVRVVAPKRDQQPATDTADEDVDKKPNESHRSPL